MSMPALLPGTQVASLKLSLQSHLSMHGPAGRSHMQEWASDPRLGLCTRQPLALEGVVEMGEGASESGSDATSELQQPGNLGCVRESPWYQGHRITSTSLACGRLNAITTVKA